MSAHKHQSVKRLSQNGSSQPCLKKSKMVQYCEYVADCTWRLKRILFQHAGEKPHSCKNVDNISLVLFMPKATCFRVDNLNC